MTPRQLMALADQHREHHDPGAGPSVAQPAAAPRRATHGPVSTAGSAGWLMAVAGGLDRNRRRRVNAPATVTTIRAPGVS
jgi:hypothetical protein